MLENLTRLAGATLLCGLLTACAATPGEAPAPAPAAVPEPVSDEAIATGYRLGQGDRISIQVFDEPDLTMSTTVGGSGMINYSYLGDVQVAGKTPEELEREIARMLRDGYLVNPSVNVSITEFRPFFINGEVRSPGSYPYRPNLTVDQAIALAGGLTDRASTRRMFVVRARGASREPQKVGFGTAIGPGDSITIQEGFF